jgi:hypothetical protein
LECARCDQGAFAPRKAGQQRCDGEDDGADDEEAPPAEEVGRSPAEEQEASEEKRLSADDPLQILLREPKVDLDRGERDIHDRDVEHHHELHGAEERQGQPFPFSQGGHIRPFVGVVGRWLANLHELLLICKYNLVKRK